MNKKYSRGSVLPAVVIGLAVTALLLTSILSHVTALALSYKESSDALAELLVLCDAQERLLSARSESDIAYVTGEAYSELGVCVTLENGELLLTNAATDGCVKATVEWDDGRTESFLVEIKAGVRTWKNAEVDE